MAKVRRHNRKQAEAALAKHIVNPLLKRVVGSVPESIRKNFEGETNYSIGGNGEKAGSPHHKVKIALTCNQCKTELTFNNAVSSYSLVGACNGTTGDARYVAKIISSMSTDMAHALRNHKCSGGAELERAVRQVVGIKGESPPVVAPKRKTKPTCELCGKEDSINAPWEGPCSHLSGYGEGHFKYQPFEKIIQEYGL